MLFSNHEPIISKISTNMNNRLLTDTADQRFQNGVYTYPSKNIRELTQIKVNRKISQYSIILEINRVVIPNEAII